MNFFRKLLSQKLPANEPTYAQGIAGFAIDIEESFIEIVGSPRDVQVARTEYAAFSITLGTMILVSTLSEDAEDKQGILNRLNSEAIDYLVSVSFPKNRTVLEEALDERYQDYSFEISYEIFQVEGKNEHGGPMFAFASVMSNAYQMEKTKTPLTKITGQLGVLLGSMARTMENTKRVAREVRR
jgi:hypothetical protein